MQFVSGTPFNNTVSVLVADHHHLVREVIRPYLLNLSAHVDLHEVSSYAEILRFRGGVSSAPNLLLLELAMPYAPSTNKLEGLREVCEALPDTAVVVFSSASDALTIAGAIKCGARGYIPKSFKGSSVTAALRLVLDGEVYTPSSRTNGRHAENSSRLAPAAEALLTLSHRERLCLRYMAEGLTNSEIAKQLSLQTGTIKSYLRNAYRKLGVSRRMKAMRIVMNLELGGRVYE